MTRNLSNDEILHFREHGYVIVRNVLRNEDFAGIERDYTALVHAKAVELKEAGHIANLHEDAPFAKRLALIAGECQDDVFSKDLCKWGLQLDTMYALQESVFRFFFSDRLLDCIESIVGGEITLSPIQHLRPFLPSRGGKQPALGASAQAPWHQDQGVTREEADASEILTCWIPFVDVTADTGCMKAS